MIAIIGAGPCGLYAASRLHELGLNVRVFTCSRPAVHFRARNLRAWIQAPGKGGRARLWGGWTDFPSRSEFEREAESARWPLSYSRLREGLPRVRRWLRIEAETLSLEFSQAGFQAKQRACRTWSRWPFPVVQNLRALRLEEENGRITGFSALNEKTRRIERVEADEVILCASPFSTISLLGSLSRPPPGLGSGISNHMVSGWLGLQPRIGRKRAASRGYKKTNHGVLEIHGPLSGRLLHPAWGDQEFYRIHFIGRSGPKSLRIDNFEVSGLWRWTARERAQAQRTDRLLRAELLNLSPRLRCFQIQKPLHPANIAHESGGAVLGKTIDLEGRVLGHSNLFVMDASALPSGLAAYPTLPLLAVLESFLSQWPRPRVR